MHAKIENGTVVEYPITNLAQKLPHVSLPSDLTKDELLPAGFVYVHTPVAPDYNRITQKVEQDTPVYRDGKWVTSWKVIDLDAAEIASNEDRLKKELVAVYSAALDRHFDSVAAVKRYDSRVTCALRAGYPGPFQADGIAYATWMDECNALAYRWWAEIEAGTKPMFASPQEFIDELPQMTWPSVG